MKKKLVAALLAGVMVLAAGCGSAGKVTVGQYKGLEVTNVSEETLQGEIDAMLEAHATLEVVDREAADGDTVNINYAGTKEGVAFEGGTDDSEDGTDLKLGSNSFIDGFEDGLIGSVAGETRELDLTFPENYSNAELAGQAVVFTVTVNEVKETVIPELTDAFIAENFEEYASVQEYTDALRASLNENSHQQQIIQKLMENSTVEKYDEKAVEEDKQNLISSYTSYASMYSSYLGIDAQTALYYFFGFESTEALETYAGEYAYELEKQDMILAEIAKQENITVSKEEYAEKAVEYAEMYGFESVEALEAQNGKELIEEVIVSEKVMDFLVENAVVTE